jgi:uncharacterized membrane protein YedE/YeeE
MKQRILTGWTFTRALYLLIGAAILMQGIMDKQWPGILFGGYFASMGIFAFGCASGACYTGNSFNRNAPRNDADTQEVLFEEVKRK